MPKNLEEIIKFMTTKRREKETTVIPEPLVAPARVTLRKWIKMQLRRIWYWILRKKEEVRTGVSMRQRVKRYNAMHAEKGDR